MKKYKNRIRDLREDRDLRQTDVSKATGIDQKTLSNYETGNTSPDSYALIRLADFFGVSIDYLVGRTEIDIKSKEDLTSRLEGMKNMIDEIIKSL